MLRHTLTTSLQAIRILPNEFQSRGPVSFSTRSDSVSFNELVDEDPARSEHAVMASSESRVAMTTFVCDVSVPGPRMIFTTVDSFAADVSAHVETAAGILKLTQVLLRLAEIEAETESLEQNDAGSVDKMLHDLYVSAAPELKGTSDFARSFIAYTLIRTRNHLEYLAATTPVSASDTDTGEQPSGNASRVRWDILCPLMFHVLNSCLVTEIVTPSSFIGRLYQSPGLLTVMEVVSRAGTLQRQSVIQLASTIAGSLFLVGWVLGQRHIRMQIHKGCACVPFLASKDADETILHVCISYLGTILKLQRRLKGLLLLPAENSSLSRMAVSRLQEGMTELVILKSIPWDADVVDGDGRRGGVESCGSGNGNDRPSAATSTTIRGLVGKAMLEQTSLLQLSCVMALLTEDETRRLSSGVKIEEDSRDGGIGDVWKTDACTNPGCVSLAGYSEGAMKTLLCSGCRRARYCSRACQCADFKAHGPGCSLE